MFDILKEISVSEKRITDTNHDKIKKCNELFRKQFERF